MLMLEGRKHWRFYEPDDAAWLAQDDHFTDFRVDVFNESSFASYPLLNLAQPCDVIQEPGEFLFIPGGVPHAVANVDNTMSLAGNLMSAESVYLQLFHHLAWRGSESRESAFKNGATHTYTPRHTYSHRGRAGHFPSDLLQIARAVDLLHAAGGSSVLRDQLAMLSSPSEPSRFVPFSIFKSQYQLVRPR
jgi:hypothetical protein